MSGRDMDFYLDNPEDFEKLSEEDKALLASGGTLQGDTANVDADASATEESSDPPAAAEAAEDGSKDDATAKTDSEPVVVAKDGKHTIPYSELEAAREQARRLEQELRELRDQRQASVPAVDAKKEEQAAEAAKSVADASAALADLVRERDDALYSGDSEKAHSLSLKIIGIQNEQSTKAALAAFEERQKQERALSEQQTEEQASTAKAQELVAKYTFLNPDSPDVNQDAIDLVVARRDQLLASGMPLSKAIEQAVEKVAPLFSREEKVQPVQTQSADVAKKAAEAIEKAKSAVPTSLSSAPAGASPHHDESESLRAMSGLGLLGKFAGKSPEEIERMISRAI